MILEITQPQRPPLSTLLLALVRPLVPLLGTAGRRPRRLHLPAGVGAQLPLARGPRRADGRRRPRADPLHGPRRRHHRDPQRRCGLSEPRRSAVPPPVTAVIDAASAWLPARLGAVERRLRELQPRATARLLAARRHGDPAAGGKRLRPLLVLLCAGAEGRRGGGPRRDRGRAGPHGDPGPRRRPRRRAAAPRAPDRRRDRRAATGRPRPATCSSRAPSRCSAEAGDAAPGRAAQRRLGGAGRGRAGPAPRRLRHLDQRRALPRALPAEDRRGCSSAPA